MHAYIVSSNYLLLIIIFSMLLYGFKYSYLIPKMNAVIYVSSNYWYLRITYLYKIIWFQVFRTNAYNFYLIIWFSLFNGISRLNGIFNAENLSTCKCLIIMIIYIFKVLLQSFSFYHTFLYFSIMICLPQVFSIKYVFLSNTNRILASCFFKDLTNRIRPGPLGLEHTLATS